MRSAANLRKDTGAIRCSQARLSRPPSPSERTHTHRLGFCDGDRSVCAFPAVYYFKREEAVAQSRIKRTLVAAVAGRCWSPAAWSIR